MKKLSHFRKHQAEGKFYFTSRAQDHLYVVVTEQENGQCVALPMAQSPDYPDRVCFHPKTIKSLVEFLEGK